MVVFRMLCKTTWSSGVHETESVSVVVMHGRRQYVPHGRTRDSEASLTRSRPCGVRYCQIVMFSRRTAKVNDDDDDGGGGSGGGGGQA